MFGKLKVKKQITKSEYSGRINLPMNGLSSTVAFYESYGEDKKPMSLVVIYNVEQLATEISKHLKNGCNHCGNGNDDNNESPIPA